MASYPDQVRAAERAAIRKRRRRRGGKPGMSTLRTAELDRLFDHRYRDALLPDNDAGRGDVRIMLHTLGRRSDPLERIEAWLARRAPWFAGDERHALVSAVMENPLRWRADTLGKLLGLTSEVRTMLRIRTIGPIDCTAAERKEARRLKSIERKAAIRRANGRPLRSDQHRNTLNSRAPWKAEGISARTWFRRQARARSVSASATV